MVPVAPDRVGERGIARRDRAALPGRHDLARVEGEAAHDAERAAGAVAIPRPEGTGRVLHEGDPGRDGGLELLPRHGAAEQMNGHDRLRPRRDRCRDPLDVEVERVGVDVDDHGPGATQLHRVGGGGEGVRRHDHLVARPDVERHHREVQGCRARGDGDGVLGSARDRD